jgi:hypothetical protein
MSGFYGYKLSEVATVAVMLLAFIPIAKSAAAFNFLPVIGSFLTFATLSTVQRLTFGLKVFISLLVAMILVPTPFRGRRFFENFEDVTADDEEDDNKKPDPAIDNPSPDEGNDGKGDKYTDSGSTGPSTPPMMETMKNEEDEEPEPAAADIEKLSAKFLGTKSKKYRLPSEKEDGEHHMDTGTTFMNAYKKLKPEQIQSLTMDTQKLITVQKDLMANLNNLKPLVSDGKEIMKTFKSFFGSEPSST